MNKQKKAPDTQEAKQVMDIDPDTYEFRSLADFETFNRWARKNGHPVRVPTEEYHKKVKIKFQRFDQPDNVLKVRVRNRQIDWSGQLIPGKTYNLPKPVIHFLNRLATPIYKEVKVNDGGETTIETQQVGEKSRFSCQIVDFGDDD